MTEARKQSVDQTRRNGAYTLAPKESEAPLKDYGTLDFKELLAACPLDGIELTRASELPRAADF
ncbi:MAG: hypothetical protein F4Z22_03110 [Acidimicrobiia bacterium]|nr:hypothetical protein [Acidimicrobiia bacterium]